MRAPHYRMRNLLSLDRRIEANREGLLFSGADGQRLCEQVLQTGEPMNVFAAALIAYSGGSAHAIREATRAALESARTEAALIAALAWLPFEKIDNTLKHMIHAPNSRLHRIAIRIHGAHRRAPGDTMLSFLQRADPHVAAAAARTAGELRLRDGPTVSALSALLDDGRPDARFWAAWSLTLLGRREGIPLLEETAASSSPRALDALQLLLLTVPCVYGRAFVSKLAKLDHCAARAVLGCGLVGDPASIDWLIGRMRSPLARVAGEAFSMITGADLAYLDLDGEVPEADPAPADTAIDAQWTDNLPDPDPQKVGSWWRANADRFMPGQRYLCGEAPTRSSLIRILKHGYQRQRRVAALLLALSHPDDALFETRMRSDLQHRRQVQWS